MFAPGYWGVQYFGARYWPPEDDVGEPVPPPRKGGVDAEWREYRRGVHRPWNYQWRDQKLQAELRPVHELLDSLEAIHSTSLPMKTKRAKLAKIRTEAKRMGSVLEKAKLPELGTVRTLVSSIAKAARKLKIDREVLSGLRKQTVRIERRRKNNEIAMVALLLST